MKQRKYNSSLKSFTIISFLIAFSLINLLKAESEKHHSFDVKIKGEGNPIIFIHGYASDSSVWEKSVEFFSKNYECHNIQLAGFAGRKAIVEDEYLSTIRDEITEYITTKKLKNVTIIGHSLGGFLSLWINSEYPNLVKKVVSVDGLPFLGAVMNPNATAESMIETAKKQFRYDFDFMPGENGISDEQRMMYLQNMTIHKEKLNTLLEWTKKSDGRTLNQAMFELMVTDIREDLKNIKNPVLVLGAWIAYKNYGATRESTYNLYKSIYSNASNLTLDLTDKGKHFIMWDDFEFFTQKISNFLNK